MEKVPLGRKFYNNGMASSVKIRDADKARLDRLQAELSARLGTKVSQQELLSMLIELGSREKGAYLPRPAPIRAAEWRRLTSLMFDSGRRTREEDIDRDIYEYRS